MEKEKAAKPEAGKTTATLLYEDVYDFFIVNPDGSYPTLQLTLRKSELEEELRAAQDAVELDTDNDSAKRMIKSIESKLAAIVAAGKSE
tara:strand:- start:2356 stop:2622 length:267 start_codon:yes stop_codon:yes gene_type:complete